MFNPPKKYHIEPRTINLKDFADYPEDYVVRPPYQRKSVWSQKKKLDLLDSLFRRYYIPRIVIREVQISDQEVVKEIIDGQQRIVVAQEFFGDRLRLPKSLADINPELPGKKRSQLPVGVKKFVDKQLVYDADIVTGIEDPTNPRHQEIATEVFWRLQQGESLTYMEVAHARLSSLHRNFVVKYADDIGFDYEQYKPCDENRHKHPVFNIIDRPNNRMQHLALLTRFLILERDGGPADVKNTDVMEFIDQGQRTDGIGKMTYEKDPVAKAALSNMTELYNIFRNDPMVADGSPMKELRIEYFIISFYLLLRHLRKHYVFGAEERQVFREFTLDFYQQWRERGEQTEILVFSDHRQQSVNDIELRHQILRLKFFEYVRRGGGELYWEKDRQRLFDEDQRIAVYRRDKGLCAKCLENGLPEREALVSWGQYDADHVIPHSKGGATETGNAQVLCHAHNLSKGAAG